MKVNFKSVAAAVALALAAGTASAAPIAYDGLFFSAWDQANNTSIIVNLGLDIDDVRANPSTPYTLSGSALAGLQSWMGTANTGSVLWNVMGVKDDGTGGNIPPSPIYGGTSTSTNIETTIPDWGSFGGLDTTVTTTPTFLNTVNPFLASSDVYVGSGITAYKFAGQDGGVGFQGFASVGTAMGFYNFFANPDASFFEGGYTKLAGTWNLTAAGALGYTVATTPPPVVPVPAALWLLGSGLIGLVGIGRRKVAVAA